MAKKLMDLSHPTSASMSVFQKHFTEELDENREQRFLVDPKLYNPERNVMVRILSPFQLPVDWETRTVDQSMVEKAQKKTKDKGTFFSTLASTTGKIKEGIADMQNQNFWKWSFPFLGADKEKPEQKEKENLQERGYVEVDAIMVHIHGGGFIAMSSSSHQSYSRKYANELEIPIFSIDYRLAPENPYPAALNDVWQAYFWLVTNWETQFGIKPAKIIVTGDSAGGNLTCALTMLCIERHFRVPDFILPAYPALNLSMRNFSPSLILSLDDFILPSSFLMLCVDSYVKDADAENDHFLSPGNWPENVLERFPPTRIMTAGNDPLRDEQYRFVLKLIEAGVNIKCKEYLHFPHGFLSLDLPVGGIEECSNCIEQAIAYFKETLERDPLEYEHLTKSEALVEGRPASMKKVPKMKESSDEETKDLSG